MASPFWSPAKAARAAGLGLTLVLGSLPGCRTPPALAPAPAPAPVVAPAVEVVAAPPPAIAPA
ncbi:MAG: hypothetical protein PSV13_08265, partial [Lacunisphaera sp.]|nr:hypothetical protein [Lacunisphaera sp.]